MIRRVVVLLITGALTVTGLVFLSQSGSDQKTMVATFPRTTSLYEGAKVKVLGVQVGSVETIEVVGTSVEVSIAYDAEVPLPADVNALIVPPSIVGDRFIQLAPAYVDGPKLAEGAEIGLDRTGVPVELDETYSSIDELATALGPKGANRDGSLSRLTRAAARSLSGRGEQFNLTIKEAAAAVSTLAASSDDANATVTNLARLTKTLAGKDAELRRLVRNLANVGTQLNGQRDDIAQSVEDLRGALKIVGAFIRKNRKEIRKTVAGVTDVSDVLAKRTEELSKLVDLAPNGLTGLINIYSPDNYDLSNRDAVPLEARTGTQTLRAPLLEDLDVQLGFLLSGVCAQLPGDVADQLAGLCGALQQAGGDLGGLLTELSTSGVLNPTAGSTSLGGLLQGGGPR